MRSRLIDRLSLPVTASAADVLKEALRIGERLERQMEEQIVNDLIIATQPTICYLNYAHVNGSARVEQKWTTW